MKNRLAWLIGSLCVAATLVFMLRSQNKYASTAIAEPAKEETSSATAESAAQSASQPSSPQSTTAAEKVVYTFADDAKMKDFTNLWRQRQGIVLRMTVLQAYWSEEQNSLTQLNNKFSSDYKLDVSKNYILDDKRRVLIERETPLAPEQEAPTSAVPVQGASAQTSQIPSITPSQKQ